MRRKTGAFFYGLFAAILTSIIPMFFADSILPPIFYIGWIIFFTPFIMSCRLMEPKRKEREKEE